MNQQQLSGSGPPIASSSRLPPIKSLQHNHPFDDQDQAQAAAALLQIKRSPSAVHAPLLPSFQEIHSAYSNAYPTPGSNGAEPSTNNLFPYLPPIRTDFQQYKPQGTSSAGPSTAAPAYFPSTHAHTSPTTFLPYQFTPNSAQPHSPASPPRKRKRSTLLELAPHGAAPPSDHNGKGKYRESELPIDVEGDGDQEMGSEAKGAGNDEPEGEVRCICGYNGTYPIHGACCHLVATCLTSLQLMMVSPYNVNGVTFGSTPPVSPSLPSTLCQMSTYATAAIPIPQLIDSCIMRAREGCSSRG